MKWVLIVVAILLLFVGIIALVGMFVPRQHVATVRATFKAPPEALYDLIADFERFASWRSDVKSVERLAPVDGKTSYREKTGQGEVSYVVEVAERPDKLVLRIADDDLPYGGTWTFEITGNAEGTLVSITENGEIKPAIFRALAHFVFGYHATMEGYLKGLGTKFGEQVSLERVR